MCFKILRGFERFHSFFPNLYFHWALKDSKKLLFYAFKEIISTLALVETREFYYFIKVINLSRFHYNSFTFIREFGNKYNSKSHYILTISILILNHNVILIIHSIFIISFNKDVYKRKSRNKW